MRGAATPEVLVGVDFAGPATAAAQRRKILAVAAERLAPRRYAIARTGLNARLLEAPPGWTAAALAEALVAPGARIAVVAADFPFSIPAALLQRDAFARLAGFPRAFRTWRAFNAAVAAALPLAAPVDYARLAPWRDTRHWLMRATDVPAGAQPALKHAFQVLFNMTLLGNALLARLDASGRFDVVPFQRRGRAPVIEIYPGHLLRTLGVRDYKRAARRAIDAALAHLASVGVALRVDPAVRAACEAYDTGGRGSHDHDAADALVAACGAILYREGLARELTGTPASARAVEGAIWSVDAELSSSGRGGVSRLQPASRAYARQARKPAR